jgi:hypothetical protein
MNLNDIGTQLLFTTVPIWTESASGSASSATAFIYNAPVPDKQDQSIPLLITNRHVVFGARRALIELVEKIGDTPATDRRVRAEIDAASLAKHTNERLDLAVIPLGPLLNQLERAGRPAFFRSVGPELIPTGDVLRDLAALEDVVFIGYPSGLRDEKNANPLIRRGITSTPVWNDFQGDPCFLIDAGVFPGSSGSPVFILNQGAYPTKTGLVVGSRLLFLGVLAQSMIRSAQSGEVYLGLGKVIRSTAVKSFVDEAVSSLVQGGLTKA